MATYVDVANVVNRIRALLPNIGNIYFVDTDAGVDAAGRGTYALPLKTIDYAIANYVTAYNGDAVICWGSAGGSFDENANVDGVRVSKASTTVVAVGMPQIDNTNAGGTSIFYVTAQGCRIWGFYIYSSTTIIGIHCDSSYNLLGNAEFANIFEHCSRDIQLDAPLNIGEGNGHINSTCAYYLTKGQNRIRRNYMRGTGFGGTVGVNMIGSNENYVHDNDITLYGIGIQAAGGVTQCTGTRNAINCTIPIADLNAHGLNNWSGNQIVPVQTTTDFSYLVAGGEQTVFTYGAFDFLERRFVGSFDVGAFTVGKVITVRIYEQIGVAGWQLIETKPLITVGTDPNPHFDYTSFVTNRVTMQVNIVEAGNTPVPRKIAAVVIE